MNKRLWKTILPVLAAALLLCGGVFYYLRDVQSSLWDQAATDILEVTSQGSHAFEVYIEKDIQILSRVIKALSRESSEDRTPIADTMGIFEDGEILICSHHKDGNHDIANLLDALKTSDNDAEAVRRFGDSMKREEEGVNRFFF
ncbi:MAG: hypothetical protein NC341_03530 [Blautia sp.]|nr:hypothetical protein [Blautia sp.]MCM1200668.1 hypothetical protein [Bacteroides fragilis]